METLRAKFLRAYASVPEKMRSDIIAIIGENPYSWHSAYVEINGKTELGNMIIKKLEEIGVFKGA